MEKTPIIETRLPSIGSRLRTARESRGMSQGDLASVLRISRQMVNMWEQSIHYPSSRHLALIAATLHIDLNWLISGFPVKKT